MRAEYVRLSGVEKAHGQKGLLYSQLELLDLIKRFKTYKLLRNEEMLLKVMLKAKIAEAMVNLKKLDKILPVVHFHEPKRDKDNAQKKNATLINLHDEIEMVRRKIENLQRGW